MTKLDAMIDRLKALPDEEQARLAMEIECLLDAPGAAPHLTDAQWRELDARLASDGEEGEDHDMVMKEMKTRFGL